MDGLSVRIKESLKEYTFSKDLWFKLEEEHQRRRQDKEDKTEVKSTEDEKQE